MTQPKYSEPQIPLDAEVTIDMDGDTGDPLMRALAKDFPQASDKEALDMALMLQQVVRGQASILSNMDRMSEEIAKLRAQAVLRDKAMEQFRVDQEKFLRNAEANGERLRTSDPSELAKMGEKARDMFGSALATARIKRAEMIKRERIRLEQEPKTTIVSPGELETQVQNGSIVSVIIPEVIRYKNMKYVLPPGVAVNVPNTIAALWKERQDSRQVKSEYDRVMGVGAGFSASNQMEVMAGKMAEINQRHGLKGQSVLDPSDADIAIPV